MQLIFSTLDIILFIALMITLYAFIIGAPIFFTPKKAIRDALDFCQPKPGSKFFDLGAGTGRALLVASKEYKLKSTGFELSPILFIIAKLNIFFFGNSKAKLLFQNFYSHDLSGADIVFCFLTPKAMRKLKNKFQKELAPGARIISYGFSIPDWEPEKIIRNDYPGKIFIYRV